VAGYSGEVFDVARHSSDVFGVMVLAELEKGGGTPPPGQIKPSFQCPVELCRTSTGGGGGGNNPFSTM
jgi:hypothetical protein